MGVPSSLASDIRERGYHDHRERDGVVVRSRTSGAMIETVVVDHDGRSVVSRAGKTIGGSRSRRSGSWMARVASRASELERLAGSALRCRCGKPYVFDSPGPVCSGCGDLLRVECPEGHAMALKLDQDGTAFWACDECGVARKWDPDKFDIGVLVRRARRVLTNKLIAHTEVATKLLEVLERDPDKAIPLVLGDKTPKGLPTLEAVLRKRAKKVKRRVGGKRVRSLDPLADITLYEDEPERDRLTVIRQDETGGPTLPASLYKHHEITHATLNPIQSAVLPYVEAGVNMVVAASTSAGKTVVAEMVMGDALARGGKAIFLSPLRAVSQEKFDDWSDASHPWGDLQVSILTGDYTLTEARKRELSQANVIVMTSEMLDSKTRRMKAEQNTWLLQTMVLVVDEAHLLTMEGRGDALESGLMRFTAQNPHARIVLLSATMPNVDQLGEWLTHLNGRPSVVINSEWRPTELGIHWVEYHDQWSYQDTEDEKRVEAIGILREYKDDKFIVFVHSKKAGRQLLEELNELGESVEFHSADLDRDRRLDLERRFRHGSLRVVIATSTLAYGVNMPARRVIVLGVHRGINEVDPIDVKQMVGRAGRVGLDPRGDAYILIPDRNADDVQERFETIGLIQSRINNRDALAFHLTAEVAGGRVETERDAHEWHARSLAAFQGFPYPTTLEGVTFLEQLASIGILSQDDEEAETTYSATMLGKISSWLYFSPFDVAAWCWNFDRLAKLDRLRNTACVAWALGNISTGWNSYLPKELARDQADMIQRLRSFGIEIKTAIPPSVLAYEMLLTGSKPGALVSLVRGLQFDSRRVVQAIKMIDEHVLDALGEQYCDQVGVRVQYGCSWQEAELCRLPGIGAKFAAKLISFGLKTVEDVAADPKQVRECLGKKRAGPVIEEARMIVGSER